MDLTGFGGGSEGGGWVGFVAPMPHSPLDTQPGKGNQMVQTSNCKISSRNVMVTILINVALYLKVAKRIDLKSS